MQEQSRSITTTVTFDNQQYEIALEYDATASSILFIAKQSLTNETWKGLLESSDTLFDVDEFFLGMEKAANANRIEISLD